LSAEDLGILLQWHWKYGTATFTHRDNEDTKTIKPSPPSPSASPRPSSDQCPFCFFEDSLPPADRMRRYARIDSLRRHVLRIHLNQASRHDYGLRGLPQPPSDTVTENGPIICPEPACNGLVLQGQIVMLSLPRNPPIRPRWREIGHLSLQRSVSVRSRAEVIIMHTPSTSDACETHA
jgi:hypothetical protein